MAAALPVTSYKGSDIEAAYNAIYGGLPANMMDLKTGNLLPQYQEEGFQPGQVLKTPTGQEIPASQLMYMYQTGQAQTAQGQSAQAAQSTPAGYYQMGPPTGVMGNVAPVSTNFAPSATTIGGGGGGMTWSQTAAQLGLGANDITEFQRAGFSPDQVYSSYKTTGGPPSAASAAPAAPNPAAANQPETNALAQMGQIDPASETLRQAVANSYLTPLQQAQTPSAADYKTYLDQFKQLDPEEYAQRQGLATSMDSYLKQAQAQAALGSQLDPVTARQVEQQTRAGQAARGNVYGTPQMVEEAMTTGQAGLALQQQRQAQLGTALGAQQSYLGSGLGLGDTAMSLYQQNRANLQNAQGGALNYLGSGQTPYQAGASYLNQANQNAAAAAQGGPVYNPSALGASSQAAQIPQYGLDIGQQAQNWYNSFSAYGGSAAPAKNKTVSAATGALSGAASGALAGSAAGPYGTLIGAGVGAVAGGVGGYYS
jgi:hypothetical protein